MAKIQFLIKFLVVTCFLGGVASVTDKEFEVFILLFLRCTLNLIEVRYFFIGTIFKPI